MSDIHGIVFEVMGSIPEYISNAERYKAIYKSTRNVKLVKKTALLYTAIVVALAQTFDYLGERSIGMCQLRLVTVSMYSYTP